MRAVGARAASSSCAQCNRAFCLNYNLPICKDAEEKDVVTSCFQRDSRKDQIIVWGFILGTAGLLGWAGLRRLLELRGGKLGDGSGVFGSLPLGIASGSGSGGGRAGALGGRSNTAPGGEDGRSRRPGLFRRVMSGAIGEEPVYSPLGDPQSGRGRDAG